MRPPRAFLAAIVVTLVVGACSDTTASPVPGSTSAPPTPVIATPTPGPIGATYWLRMTSWQAIPPQNLFAFTPAAVITGDGRLLLPGAVPAIFPGPLVMPLFARQVTAAGREAIIGWARELGLLSGKTDFVGDLGLPGGVTGRIELTVDGQLVTLNGVPEVDGVLEPGSPAAFAELWRRVASLPETLASELGPEEPYVPTAYAILVGPPPEPQAGLPGSIADWPLEIPLATFGGPVLDGSYRCGLVDGEDAAILRPALEAANQLTQWTQDPATSATFGLLVRPIVAGENPCAEVFGF